ncbi:Predicted endoplasmic reticulum membrane protein Lec35/MPDU1 involved in monosaccharide-P-dolichol utilization [Ceraceosorus bombacis]|uniref:Predicted endoplasmic reticulum membrane protein Lec35/MPDU1 involved in monosaccharide-P-dolichol utilization n=1 Tax=Ceraceosorus bombacis TaxID=401625 RepID=A0A0P1BQQ4_9BASI|nr:Predicted endoplasmic reticulum membrane protein Lec35/MPDU1 involved in monosaccharide-P-dolichol utilization [Ceraceosorus bombacis]
MQSLIQFVGRRLPGFLREAVISILGLDCYITLLYNGDILDRYCLSLGISKALGAGIVIFGSILKIPQIFKIVRNRSAAGVSLGMYALEVLAYDISLAYAVRRRIPFSTYGENASLTVQNMLITLLIMHYKPASTLSTRSTSHARSLLLAALSMLLLSYALFTPAIISDANLAILQLFSIPISLLSKVPQIRELHFRKRTGQLSALVVFAQLAGTIARVFTTLTETSDKLLLWGFSLASLFNAFIAAQYIYYWNGNSSTIYTPHMSARERELRRIANARNAVGLHPLYKKVDDEDHRANSLSNPGAAGGWAQESGRPNGSEGAWTQEGKGWEGQGRPEPLDLQGNSSSATYGNSLERRLPSAAANGLGASFEEVQTNGSPSAKGLGRSNTIGSRAHSGANVAGYDEGEQMEYLLPSSPSLRGMGAIDVDSAYAHEEEEDRGGDTFSIRLPSEVDTGGLLSPRSSSGNLRRLKASRSWNSLAAQAAPVVVEQAAEKTEEMKMGLGLALGQAGLPRARGAENVQP